MWLRLTKSDGGLAAINMDLVTDFSRALDANVTKIRTTTIVKDHHHIIEVTDPVDAILDLIANARKSSL